MALLGRPMLLTTPTTLNAHPETFLTQNRDTIDAAFIFGGSGAVSNLVEGRSQPPSRTESCARSQPQRPRGLSGSRIARFARHHGPVEGLDDVGAGRLDGAVGMT
jgi:hypothetical protein